MVAALGCSQATVPFIPKTVERPPDLALWWRLSLFGTRVADL